MALSNWDTLAVGNYANASAGVLTSETGTSVAIYKNWLYIRDERMWRPGNDYSSPTIMEMQEGTVSIGNIEIIAKRGPNEGVYVLASTRTWLGEGKGFSPVKVMAGMGIYGYTDTAISEGNPYGWTGVRQHNIDFLQAMIKEHMTPEALVLPDGQKIAIDPSETEKAFLELNFENALRHNQGDAFFASEFGIDTPATTVGDEEKPMMMDAIEGFKKGLEE